MKCEGWTCEVSLVLSPSKGMNNWTGDNFGGESNLQKGSFGS